MADRVIPLTECVRGHCYALHSRNLLFGVFDGDRGFVGVRQKFGERYLDTEYHRGDGASPLGTARPYLDLGPCPLEDLRESWIVEGTHGRRHWHMNEVLFAWLEAQPVPPDPEW